MKRILKVLKWVGIGLVVIVIGFVVFVYVGYNRKYEAPYPEITASKDSSLIARGEYLVYGPAHCVYCHAPVSEITRVLAGEKVPLSGGFDFIMPPGNIYTPNITPDAETGIGDFTDGEIARTLRYGVKHDGSPLIDFMPFYDISDRDLTAIISYLRTVPPVKNKRPANEWKFLGKAILAFGLVKPMGDGEVPAAPEPDSTAVYGKYLAESVANCAGCHSPRSMMTGAYIGPKYSGQSKMEITDMSGQIIPGKHLVTPNLTPDQETGRIALWPQEVFIARFRAGEAIPGTPMPWGAYKTMTDSDLKAIYKFLKTLDPVNLLHRLVFRMEILNKAKDVLSSYKYAYGCILIDGNHDFI